MPESYKPEVLKKLQETELSMYKDFKELCEKHDLTYFGIGGTGIGALRHKGFIPWDDDMDLAMPRADFEKLLLLVESEWKGKYYILNNKTCENYPMMTTRLCKCGTMFQERVMKDVDCPFGIFLDLYVMDNIADEPETMNRQAWTAWFWSKLLVLSCMEKPYITQTGWKADVILGICKAVNRLIRFFRISPSYFREKCEKVCRKYENIPTRRMAFLPDTNPFWNIIDKQKMFPLLNLPFEDTRMIFTGDIDEVMRQQYGDYMTIPLEEKRKTHYPYKLQFKPGENAQIPETYFFDE